MNADHVPLWFVLVTYGLLSLVVGSFISLLTWRLPVWIQADTPELWCSIASDRSRCTHCHKTLAIWQLIPIVGWLLQYGKSSCCGHSISLRYPLIELTSLVLTLTVLSLTPLTITHTNGSIHFTIISELIFIWGLLAISITDIEYQIIPDRFSLSLLWLGLIINTTDSHLVPLIDAIWGAVLGYISLWLLFQIHRALTGKVGMGYGDFKLTSAIGAWLGWQALMPLFIMAGSGAILMTGMAMLMGKHHINQRLAFGPWLSMAGGILLIWMTTT